MPGEFDTYFPDTLDTDLTPALGDGFAQAQLEGWFGDMTLDTDTWTVTPDLSLAGGQLVVCFAGYRMVRGRLLNMTVSERYQAGTAQYETTRSSMVLRDLLKEYRTRIDDLTTKATRATTAYVIDAYINRSAVSDWGAFYPYEVA